MFHCIWSRWSHIFFLRRPLHDSAIVQSRRYSSPATVSCLGSIRVWRIRRTERHSSQRWPGDLKWRYGRMRKRYDVVDGSNCGKRVRRTMGRAPDPSVSCPRLITIGLRLRLRNAASNLLVLRSLSLTPIPTLSGKGIFSYKSPHYLRLCITILISSGISSKSLLP